LQLISRLKTDPRNEDVRSMTKLHVREVLQKKAESDAEQQRKKNMKDFGQVMEDMQKDFDKLTKSKNPIVFGSKLIGIFMNAFASGEASGGDSKVDEDTSSAGKVPSKVLTNSKLELKGAFRSHKI
jgi:hypothetical protein